MASDSVYYLAYGSNLHPARIQARCPSATWVQSVYLEGYQLAFHCVGQDQSGKGDLIKTGNPADKAIAAVFAMDSAEKPILDEIEGPPYQIEYLALTLEHGNQQCFVYLARETHINQSIEPYDWYQQLIYWGAKYNRACEQQLTHIMSFNSITDPDVQRRTNNQQLVAQMQESISQ